VSDDGSAAAGPEAVFDGILDTDLDGCTVTVCLASLAGEDSLPTFQTLQLTEELADEYRTVARKVFGDHKKDREKDDLLLRPYTPGSGQFSHEVEYLRLTEHETIRSQVASLASPMDLGVFEDDDDFKAGLRFYVVVFQREGEEPIYCFRTYSPKKELKRSASFGAVFTGGHFDVVREPVLLFDQHIDCVSRGDTMFVLKQSNFHRIFRFFERLQEMGQEILNDIEGRISIQNFDEFATACIGDPRKLAKLRNISQNALIDSVEMKDIRGIIEEYDLSIEIVEENGQDMLVYSSAQQWSILQLLDDGYLESRLTEERYEVTSKRRHRA
jgi:hypothetical protein